MSPFAMHTPPDEPDAQARSLDAGEGRLVHFGVGVLKAADCPEKGAESEDDSQGLILPFGARTLQ